MQNSNNFINKAGGLPALTDEERLLISRAAELSARCDYSAVASCFLSPREQRILFESGAAAGGFFYGGAAGATRRKLIFLPSWIECEKSSSGVFSSEKEKQLELQSRQSYYESDEYIEKVAREQLGLVKSGELVFINNAE